MKEYVDAMKMVRKWNIQTREIKLAIGEELQTLFQPIVKVTEKAAEGNKKELESLRMAIARKPTAAVGPRTKNVDRTFGPWIGEDGQLKWEFQT